MNPAPQVWITASSNTMTEGGSAVDLVVHRDYGSSGADHGYTTVSLSASAGGATPDYTLSGTGVMYSGGYYNLTFGPSDSAVTLTVSRADNSTVEETLYVGVTVPDPGYVYLVPPYTVPDTTGRPRYQSVAIVDDDLNIVVESKLLTVGYDDEIAVTVTNGNGQGVATTLNVYYYDYAYMTVASSTVTTDSSGHGVLVAQGVAEGVGNLVLQAPNGQQCQAAPVVAAPKNIHHRPEPDTEVLLRPAPQCHGKID